MGFYAKHIFPRVMEWLLSTEQQLSERRRTLTPARGKTLEIGFGTGLNLAHYPAAVTSLTIIDNAQMLPQRVEQRIAVAPMPVTKMQLDAAGRLPFADETFDSVTSTWTLCSIADVSSALKEIRRVLKPEGQFIFMEHGRSDNPGRARWQDRLNPIEKVIGVGCHLNRPIDQLITEAGLQINALERFMMPGMPRLVGEMYRGVAAPDKTKNRGQRSVKTGWR